ncbi:MAG: undecaprenyl-phosphate glucose phosphotransferase [Candidatus Omnitrophica bacterium]|nr:undecaprenyl-phosphate glucose phosphotransferase [Candidatus Omnitrophota bacterium]
MKQRSYFLFEFTRIVSDLFMISFAFMFAYWLRFNSGIIPVIHGIPDIAEYMKPLPIICILLVFIMQSFGLYALKRRLSILDESLAVVKAMTAGLVIFMAATFIYRDFSYSRMMLLICWIDLIIFVSLGRFIINRARFMLRSTNKDFSNLLLIGTGATALRIIRHIKGNPHWNYRVAGAVAVSGEQKQQALDDVSVIGEIDSLNEILSRRDIEEVILTVHSLPREKIMSVILECEKRMIKFRLIADLLGMITSQVDMENIDGIPLLGLKESPLSLNYNRFIKRMMDLTGSTIGLIVLLPAFLIIAILVKLGSPGPVFYRQKRIGEDGTRFNILKFRTMIDKAEKETGAVWAKKDDPRRTNIGTFLRRNNLDELPQFINVLRGQMSMVGPRPERPEFVDKFKEDIPRYMSRHKIRSGVTGWAQINGLRGDTSIEERTKYDLYYVENWSLMFDIKILMMSVSQTLFSKSEHAY